MLDKFGVDNDVVALLPSTHEATAEMLNAVGYIDVCIPRGSSRLINFVRDTAKIPVIETGAGVVHAYFDKDGDLEMGKRIVNNAKTRRVSVCNALDCLIINKERIADLPALCELLVKSNVKIYADEAAYAALSGKYNDELLFHATEESFGTEFMAYSMAIKTVDSLEAAISHITENGSGHSECIITDNKEAASVFSVRSWCRDWYLNTETWSSWTYGS